MHKYKAIIFIILFSLTTLYPVYDGYWHYKKPMSLEKDDYFSATLTRGSLNKDIHIKWTLYINSLLTMQVNLDKFNHQFNLKLSRDEESFKLPIFHKAGMELEAPYLIIKFLKYDIEKKSAKFMIFLRNPSSNIRIKRGNI